MTKYKIAVLDDYQHVALESADWSVLRDRADIVVFQNHFADPDAVIERLLSFDVVCAMRERSPLPRNVIERLPNLKLIASTGPGNSSTHHGQGSAHAEERDRVEEAVPIHEGQYRSVRLLSRERRETMLGMRKG